jgi:hypothetical protein
MSTLLTAAQTVADHLDIWAAPEPTSTPEPTGEINTTGILGFFAKAIVPILLGALGVVFMTKAFLGNISQVMSSSMIAIIGLAMLAGATTLFFVGDELVNLMVK